MPWTTELLPTGRLARGPFWLRHLLVLPVALVLCSAADALLGAGPGILAGVLTSLFLISVWGRRLHDRGRSAWWLLITAIPVLGPLWLLIECGLRGSGPGAGRYEAGSDAAAPYYAAGGGSS